MAEFNKLFKTPENEDKIFDWLETNKDHKTFVNNLNRFLNLLLDSNNIHYFKKTLKTFDINEKKTSDKQLGVLLIRYHCIDKNPTLALDIYNNLGKKNRRKRHLTIIIQTLLEMGKDDIAYDVYKEFLVEEFPIETEDLVMFFNTEFKVNVFESAIEFDVIFPADLVKEKDQVFPDKELKKFILTKKEKEILLDSIKKQFNKKNKPELFTNFVNQIEAKDVIIDGANLLYYGDRSITSDSYIRLDLAVKNLEKMGKKVLIVLHERHFRVNKKWPEYKKKIVNDILKSWDKEIYYKTPRTFNDDWYAIIAAIVGDALILTNDNFNDHVFGAFEVMKNGKNLFRRWKQEYGVFYQFKSHNKVIEMDFPKKYSEEIQKINNEIHVPLSNGKWMVF
jgi:hypothetical protein